MNICTADIEANEWIKLTMLGFYDGTEYKLFSSVKLFLDYVLCEKYSGSRIYFHNGGRYDFLFLADELLERCKDIKFIPKASGLLMIIYKFKKIRIEFVDSFAILPVSLDSLIKTFEIKEKKIPIDFNKNYTFKNKKLRQHLKNDCISLHKILTMFRDKEGFLSYTLASHSLKKFTTNFFDGEIWSVNDSFDVYFRKNYYKGGRVEVYKGYGKNLYYYDINSLYPYVMLNEMPSGFPIRTKKYLPDKIGFYKIELLTKTNFQISPLAVKTKSGNYYVNGDKGDEFYLMSCELEFLTSQGIKYKVKDGYYFKDKNYLFVDFVNYYYEIKKNAKNEVERFIAKRILNSLYGKFGQKLTGSSIELYNGQKDAIIFDVMNDLVLVEKRRNIKYKGVYIASYITALARTEHIKLMYKIGVDHIYYCDTDSIITDKKTTISNEIGKLKLEANIKEGCFLLPKTYSYIDNKKQETVHFKGFSNADFSHNDLKQLLFGKIDKLEQTKDRVLGFKESLRRVNKIKASSGTYLKTATQTKVLTSKYTRRKVIQDKDNVFITIPFTKKEVDKLK